MIKIGVIGVGYLGRHHVRILKRIERVEVIGVYDIDKEKANNIGNEFEVPVFDNDSELIEDADAVFVVTPTSTHYEIGKKIIGQGKHCFIEKPLTYSLKEADELIKLSREKDVVLMTGHVERFNPVFLAIKERISNPLFIESHRLSRFKMRGDDDSVVLDLMVHDLDLILCFVKSPIKYISAAGVPVLTDSIDIANARIEFENGAIANITASRVSKDKMRKLRFFQKYCYISIDFLNRVAQVYRLLRENGEPRIVIDEVNGKNEEPLYLEDLSFVETILGEREPEITPEEARNALEVAHRILQEIEKRGIPD